MGRMLIRGRQYPCRAEEGYLCPHKDVSKQESRRQLPRFGTGQRPRNQFLALVCSLNLPDRESASANT